MINFVKTEKQLVTDLDKWLYVLKNMSQMDKIPVYLRKPIFKKLFNISEYANLTKEEKMLYDSSLKARWDNQNVLDYAVSEARKEGKQEGMKEGERNKAITIAKEMKKEGFTDEQIVKLTKLSLKDIRQL